SSLVTIQLPADLHVTLLDAQPAIVGTGAPITVRMTVENFGGAAALAVSATPLLQNGPGAATFVSLTPLTAPSIPSGGSFTFTYAYTASNSLSGNLSFSGNAFGY